MQIVVYLDERGVIRIETITLHDDASDARARCATTHDLYLKVRAAIEQLDEAVKKAAADDDENKQ
jgi:hypothetical protein